MEKRLKSRLQGDELIALEKRLAEYEGEDRMISSVEMADILKNEPKANFSFPTGIPPIDTMLNNVESGELVIVAGRTGEGKTSLMLTITKNTADKTKSAWFSFEITPRQFFTKFDFLPPLFYVPRKFTDNTIFWLEERILEAVVKYDAKMIFVDDLHHLVSLARVQGNISFEIGDVVAKLKEIAVLNNLVIFLQAHVKDPQDSTTREPVIGDIRDSGLIKSFADSVIGIWRVPNDEITEKGKRAKIRETHDEDVKAKVRIWKNRRSGKLGSFYLKMVDRFFIDAYDRDGY